MTGEAPTDADAGSAWSRFIASPGPLIPLAVIVLNLALAVVTNRVTLRDFPNSGDEYAYLLQARTFATGRLSVPSPPERRFFDCVHIINDGRYFSKYPPGWPVLLAAGVLAGLPWLVNIAAGAAALLAMHYFAKRLFSAEIANLAALLALGNPFLVFNSASYFSHPACLLTLTAFVGSALMSLHVPSSRRWPLLAGAAAGLSFLIRPYTTICVALPVLAYVLVAAARRDGWRTAVRRFGLALVPALAFLALNLAYNATLTGSALTSPFVLYDPTDLPDWSAFMMRASSRIHDTIVERTLQLSRWLPFAPLFALIYPLMPGTRARREGLLLCAIGPALLLGHALYYGLGGNQYGPRYLFEATTALLVVGAAVIAEFGRRGAALLAAVMLFNALYFTFHTGNHLRWMPARTELYDVVKERGLDSAIVFVSHSSGAMPAVDLIRNDLDFAGPVLYARDLGDWNPRLLAAYPGRRPWFFDHDPRSGRPRLRPYGEVR